MGGYYLLILSAEHTKNNILGFRAIQKCVTCQKVRKEVRKCQKVRKM
jgi:hypothetical protein